MAVTQWNKALPASGDNLTAWPAAVASQWSIQDTLLSNYRRGYTLGYSSGSTLTASAGEITVSNSGGTVRLFLQDAGSTNITFTNIDTGAEAPSTTYYVYCGTNSATAASCTFYVSTSSSAPSGITYYARLGSFYNDSASNISRITNDSEITGYGAKASKTFGTTYQALTDGIVEGYGHQTAGGSPTPGTINTGSGGGGGNNNRAGTGGKGVVIFQVPTGSYTGTVTGSPTVATVGSDTRITFTQSGSYTG